MLTNVFQCMSSNIYIEHSVRQYGQGIRWDICSFIQCCAVLCCAVLCCAVLCCAVLCCAVLCCAVLCCAVLCCAVLCCAVLCCAVLCCAVLCCAAHGEVQLKLMLSLSGLLLDVINFVVSLLKVIFYATH